VPMLLTFDSADVLFDSVTAVLRNPVAMPSRRDCPPRAVSSRLDPGASA
jgi:hypothetical protein